jgi:hypothetical protein
MEKVPISFNEQDIKEVEELASLMFGGDVYGAFPKAVRFGITLALCFIKNPQNVYTTLPDEELTILLSSIGRAEKQRRLLENANKLLNQANKV